MQFKAGPDAARDRGTATTRCIASKSRRDGVRRIVQASAFACLAGTGWIGCSGGSPPGAPSNMGGAAGSPSSTGDAPRIEDALHADVPLVDASNVEGAAERDATDATSDAIDAATMTDAGGDRSVDGGVSDSSGEDTTADLGTGDVSSGDAAPDASTEAGSADGGTCGCTAYGAPVATGTEPSSLTELSGVVASRKNPGVLYTHNDSGSNSTVIIMSDVGEPLGQLVLSNVTAGDWEDIAVGPCNAGSCIFVGEIGDNDLAYASRTIYRFIEPTISPVAPIGTLMVTADAFPFVYPDARHDAETLLVNPANGDIFIVTKVSGAPSTVYRMPRPSGFGMQVTLGRVGDLSLSASAGLVTGGDIHPCGTRMLIRTYPMIYEFNLAAGQPFFSIFTSPSTPVSTPTQDQESKGEAVTYAADGNGYLTASELDGKSSRSLFRVRCQ
jgi:hypothetical protein